MKEFQHIRKRPSMYIGDTTTRGLHHMAGELISNSVDEFLHGRATTVRVEVADHVFTVTDDGSGLPFDQPSSKGNSSLADDYMLNFHNRPSADNHAPHVHVHSPIGVGMVVVNALSQWVTIESWRDGKRYRRRFEDGVAQPISEPNQIEQSLTPNHSSIPSNRGTRISFKPAAEVFDLSQMSSTFLRRMLFESVHLMPGLKIQLQDEQFHAPGGLVDLAHFHACGSPKMFSYTGEVDQLRVQAVAIGKNDNPEQETEWMTWANGTKTHYGKSAGTHQDAFASALQQIEWNPRLALIHVIAKEPNFAGPTRTKLDLPGKADSLTAALVMALKQFEAEQNQ